MSGTQNLPRQAPGSLGRHSTRAARAPVFAITLDLDVSILREGYHTSAWQNAYDDIMRVLRDYGFTRQMGSVYLGDDSVDVVRCVLAAQALTRSFTWFAPALRDIRMLRIEDTNDLMPAVTSVTAT